MHVALVQLDIAWEDKPANHRQIERMVDAADPPPGCLLVLPELCDTGFSLDLGRIVDDRTVKWAADVARQHRSWVQAGHAIRDPGGRGRNCATIISPAGQVLATYQKVHPFGYSGEAEHFAGGEAVVVLPVGDARTAPVVCYDLRFPELFRHAVLAGAELFAVGANWPETRQDHWRSLLIARAIENQAYVVGVNRVGKDPNLRDAGGSIVVSPTGEVLAEAGSEPLVLQCELDLTRLRSWRAEFPALQDVRRELLGLAPRTWPIAP